MILPKCNLSSMSFNLKILNKVIKIMNKFNKKLLSIFLTTSSMAIFAVDPKEIANRQLEIQFAPTAKAPFTQEQDDLYFAGLLRHIIKLDKEAHNDPTSIMKQQQQKATHLSSVSDFLVQDKPNHLLISSDKSFGWSAPGAIVSALWHNGAASTPNTLHVTIEKSEEFPGKYKATIKGNGLYPHEKNRVRSAQSELTDYVNYGPQEISKYAKLEDITSAENLRTSKDKIRKELPTLQGHVKCDKYLHGTDISGVIYFDGAVAAYLLQEMNGNRHKKNTISKKPATNDVEQVASQPTSIVTESQQKSLNAPAAGQDSINLQDAINQVATESDSSIDDSGDDDDDYERLFPSKSYSDDENDDDSSAE